MHIDDPSNQDAHVLQDSLNAFDLKQGIKIPTCNKGHTLDLIITTKSTRLKGKGKRYYNYIVPLDQTSSVVPYNLTPGRGLIPPWC